MPTHDYPLNDGSFAPGVSTISNLLDKPQLLYWVAKLTREGKDWVEERDSAGRVGILAHALCMSYWTKEVVSIKGYSFDEIGQAYFCYDKFLDWPELLDIYPIAIEEPVINEELRCGGTADIFCKIKSTGKLRRIDIKTGGGLYDTHWIQLAGYDMLGEKADEHQLLWLPKDNRFDAPIRTDLRSEKRIFKYLLGIYKERQALKPPF